MNALPLVKKAALGVLPIEWLDMPRRYMNDGELEVLVALARRAGAVCALEIGCNEGRTSRLLLENVPTLRRMIGVDVPPGYEFAKAVQRREVPDRPGLHALSDPRFELRLAKRGTFDMDASDFPPLDFVFIDGDHGAQAVMHDTELARRSIRPGGIIVWHDYHDRGNVDVKPVVDDMRAAGADIRLVEGTWIAFEQH